MQFKKRHLFIVIIIINVLFIGYNLLLNPSKQKSAPNVSGSNNNEFLTLTSEVLSFYQNKLNSNSNFNKFLPTETINRTDLVKIDHRVNSVGFDKSSTIVENEEKEKMTNNIEKNIDNIPPKNNSIMNEKKLWKNESLESIKKRTPTSIQVSQQRVPRRNGVLGKLYCDRYDASNSEMVYWEDVPGDKEFAYHLAPKIEKKTWTQHYKEIYGPNYKFELPEELKVSSIPALSNDIYLSPDERFLTFAYDIGAWNNIRMGFESTVLLAFATGRTLVMNKKQRIPFFVEKLGSKKSDLLTKVEGNGNEMSLELFFNFTKLISQKNIKIITPERFLYHLKEVKKAIDDNDPVKLKQYIYTYRIPQVNPNLSSPKYLRGSKNQYTLVDKIKQIGYVPEYKIGSHNFDQYNSKLSPPSPLFGGYLTIFPEKEENFGRLFLSYPQDFQDLFQITLNNRHPVYLTSEQRESQVLHLGERLLQNFYAVILFEDKLTRQFIRRQNRDFLSYNDIIHCTAESIVKSLREEALALDPNSNGNFYALHVRRGDFQFKEVKISTPEILENLHYPDGSPIIPYNSVVYISTDDPNGVCENCYVDGIACADYLPNYPVGCIKDPSWDAFIKVGYKIRFLNHFLANKPQKPPTSLTSTKFYPIAYEYLNNDISSNLYGLVEALVASRASAFSGTFFSTFTGYIHRLRGFHHLSEFSFFNSKPYVFEGLQKKSIGNGFSREYRMGWTDDDKEFI